MPHGSAAPIRARGNPLEGLSFVVAAAQKRRSKPATRAEGGGSALRVAWRSACRILDAAPAVATRSEELTQCAALSDDSGVETGVSVSVS